MKTAPIVPDILVDVDEEVLRDQRKFLDAMLENPELRKFVRQYARYHAEVNKRIKGEQSIQQLATALFKMTNYAQIYLGSLNDDEPAYKAASKDVAEALRLIDEHRDKIKLNT